MIQLWIVAFSLILARAGTFVAILPLFGTSQVPRLVKIGLAAALSVPWFITFGLMPHQDLAERFAEPQWLNYGLALVREATLGAVLGFAFGLLLAPARIAGEFISQEMGLTMANQLDPTTGQQAGPLTQIFEMLGVLIFLGLDAHHLLFAMLHETFIRWPIGGDFSAVPTRALVGAAGVAEEWGVMIAAPIVLCLFLTAVVLALMAKAAPQLNLFSFGFALRIGVGLLAAFLLLPDLVGGIVAAIGYLNDLVLQLG